MSAYWWAIDAESTKPQQGEPVTFSWLAEAEEVWIDREREVEVGSALWMYDRPLRQVSGLAYAGETERARLYVNVDREATAKLRKNPFRPEKHVLRSEPNWWEPGQGRDRWLFSMHEIDAEKLRAHLDGLRV